jgi:hypothetical protein
MKVMAYLVISIELLFTFCSGNNLEQTVFAKLKYDNNAIRLQIINNSKDSIYFPVNDFSSLKVFFNGKRIKDLYVENDDNLSINEDELKFLISKKYPKAYSWNHENPLLVDSILFNYFLGEYRKLSKNTVIDSTNGKIIRSYITTVFQLEGGFLFLRPREVYSIDFKCGSFNKIGKYEINYNEKRRNCFTKSVTVRDNQSCKKYRIPINLPSNLLGFRRYDECINAKKIVLINSK